MKRSILIIEDDLDVQEYIKEILILKHYQVDAANDGVEGIIQFQKQQYDLVLLDIDLPNLDGYNICKVIRSQSNVPIIMVTALNSENDELKAFQVGIDDYIVKPFSFEILLKRVEAVLRRVNTNLPYKLIQFEEISLNPDSFVVYINGEKKKLTTKEFEMLYIFLKNPGRVLSREFLLNEVWGLDYYGDSRVIDAYVKKLRKKLNIPYIKTVTGIGYKIDSASEV
ncbi:DNA-binding response regulator [Bacillus thuringiensis serovar medellin]|uniref:DNA-binding response regulator n=1 Tax=Bacillus thuringiensis subsp. medellin TaxID=79672 RepID=A0A9X6R7P2_BACTV|nr:response regulator transcription factor [Bacillus thuringiensis]OUB82184.1 DNA-binding response regulator [Bacillus thuringiensis serovar medellin]